MLTIPTFAVHRPLAGIVAVIVTALPASALAAEPAQEAATAAMHAGLAAQAATIEQAHMHLHHTVNCLVDPRGTDLMPKRPILVRSSEAGRFPTRPTRRRRPN